MRYLLFSCVIALFSAAGLAHAQCVDPNGHQHRPVAVADAEGRMSVVHGGVAISLSGLKPGDMLCRDLMFKRAAMCPNHKAHFADERDANTCKGLAEGHRCVHIECDAQMWADPKPQRPHRHTHRGGGGQH